MSVYLLTDLTLFNVINLISTVFHSQCEGPCTDSTQNRKVTCQAVVEQKLVELPNNACINITRPTSVRPCNKTRCPSWRVGEWGQVRYINR